MFPTCHVLSWSFQAWTQLGTMTSLCFSCKAHHVLLATFFEDGWQLFSYLYLAAQTKKLTTELNQKNDLISWSLSCSCIYGHCWQIFSLLITWIQLWLSSNLPVLEKLLICSIWGSYSHKLHDFVQLFFLLQNLVDLLFIACDGYFWLFTL